MDSIIKHLIFQSESEDENQFEEALTDLRFLIERKVMNRFDESEESDYLKLFYNKKLIDYKIADDDFRLIKQSLVYLLFNFPDRSILIAKCLKVLFDHLIVEALCNGIEVYMRKNDLATSELIYAITNSYDNQSYLKNSRIFQVFQEVALSGGKYSAEIVKDEFKFYQRNNSNQ